MLWLGTTFTNGGIPAGQEEAIEFGYCTLPKSVGVCLFV
jgi:hypothetical protein